MVTRHADVLARAARRRDLLLRRRTGPRRRRHHARRPAARRRPRRDAQHDGPAAPHAIRTLVEPGLQAAARSRRSVPICARARARSSTPSLPQGGCDFLRDVAAELPLQVTASLFGVPQDDRHQTLRVDHGVRRLRATASSAQSSDASCAPRRSASRSYGRALVARQARAARATTCSRSSCTPRSRTRTEPAPPRRTPRSSRS